MSRIYTNTVYDDYDLGEESDQERAESSEDEIEIILHGTPEQRRRLVHTHEKEQQQKLDKQTGRQVKKLKSEREQQSSSEDEFEREMNAELDKTVHMLEKSREKVEQPSISSTLQSANRSHRDGKVKKAVYDSVYFDSDDEDNFEGEGEARVQRQHEQLSNDELLYDPNMDDEDQKWVDEQRQRQHGISNKGSSKKRATLKSDAFLDCPACMTTLCLDCQKHDIYPNQYRAMFVMNCKINTSEFLSVPEQASNKKSKKSARKADSTESAENNVEKTSTLKDKFHPVLCDECGTVVGVIDTDEVYHFFNVLASQP